MCIGYQCDLCLYEFFIAFWKCLVIIFVFYLIEFEWTWWYLHLNIIIYINFFFFFLEIGEPFKNLKWEIIFDTQSQNEIILLTGVWSEILMIQNGKFVIDIFDSDGYFLKNWDKFVEWKIKRNVSNDTYICQWLTLFLKIAWLCNVECFLL